MKKRALGFANNHVLVTWDGADAERLVNFLFDSAPQGQANEATVSLTVTSEQEPGQGEVVRVAGNVPLQRAERAAGHITVHIARLDSGSALGGRSGTAPAMADYLMERACYHLADGAHGGMLLHAACLVFQGKALLLPGASGFGKSTLAAWLALGGGRLLSDELAFIPAGSLACQGFLRPVHLKPPASELFRETLANGAIPSERGWLVPPSLLRAQETAAQGNDLPSTGPVIQAIIFPRYQVGAALTLERLSQASAAKALFTLLINARNLPNQGFAEVVRLARQVPAYQMVYENFSGLVEACEACLDQPTSV